MNQEEVTASPLKMSAGRICCQRISRKTTSLIHLADKAKDSDEWGSYEFVVVGVGDARVLDNGQVMPMPYKLGDRVMPLFNQCVSFSYKGRKYLAMPIEAVIGVEDSTVMAMLESDDITKLLSTQVSQ